MSVRILVGMKWVALRPEVDPLSGVVAVDRRFSGPSPADRSALEWALRLAGADGSVVAATVGPPDAEPMLREALATGAAHAIRVDGLPADATSRTVAGELAALASGFDLLICGNASLDRGSGSVPAFAAHELNWAQVLGVVTIESDSVGEPDLVAQRRLEGGRRELLALRVPAVLSFEAGPELRRASLAATLAATTAVVDERPAVGAATDRGLMVVARRPFRPPPRVVPAPRGTTRQRLDALLGAGAPSRTSTQVHDVSPQEAARLTMEHLVRWGYLDSDSTDSDSTDSDSTEPDAPSLGGAGATC